MQYLDIGIVDSSRAFVDKILQRWRAVGTVAPHGTGGRKVHALAAHAELVDRLLVSKRDITLEELRRGLLDEGVLIGRSSIDRYLKARGLTRKKKTAHAPEQERPDVAAACAAWREGQPTLNPARLVFIDETGASTNMARRYGRCLKGQRLVMSVPHGHWKMTTFVARLRHDRIDAPCVIEGPMNGELFRAYVEQFFAPTLAPGDIVVMGNLPAHKVKGVAEAIAARGAECATSRPTVPISTRSSRCSPSSRRCFERPPPDPSTSSGTPSASCSMPSQPPNAPTTSETADMFRHNGKCSNMGEVPDCATSFLLAFPVRPLHRYMRWPRIVHDDPDVVPDASGWGRTQSGNAPQAHRAHQGATTLPQTGYQSPTVTGSVESQIDSSSQLMVFEIFPEFGLENLARGGVRKFGNEDNVVGQPPFGNLAFQMIKDVCPGHVGIRFPDHDQ